MLRTKHDALISYLVRAANNWTCQRCGLDCDGLRSTLQASHVVTRAIGWLRYDPRNITALCAKCHSYVEARPIEHAEWYRSIDPEAYEWIQRNQHVVKKLRKGERDQMYYFYRFQKNMLDTLRFDGYRGKFKIIPWSDDLYV